MSKKPKPTLKEIDAEVARINQRLPREADPVIEQLLGVLAGIPRR